MRKQTQRDLTICPKSLTVCTFLTQNTLVFKHSDISEQNSTYSTPERVLVQRPSHAAYQRDVTESWWRVRKPSPYLTSYPVPNIWMFSNSVNHVIPWYSLISQDMVLYKSGQCNLLEGKQLHLHSWSIFKYLIVISSAFIYQKKKNVFVENFQCHNTKHTTISQSL